MTPLLVAFLAAPFAGSLVGVLARRLPVGRPVVLDRSRCEACTHPLGPADLVPILSYAALRGRCRYCHAPIARMHLWVELAALLVPASLWAAGITDPATVLCSCLLGFTLLCLTLTDATHYLLPDVLTLPLILAGLAATAWLAPEALADHAAATIAAYATLAALAWAYRKFRGREGLGGGDPKLFAAAGAWAGTAGLSPILLLASLAGLAAYAAMALAGRTVRPTTRLPFGCVLAPALWLAWLYANAP